MAVRSTSRLRALLAQPGCVVAPGVADACELPVIADTGYGNPINTRRAIRDYAVATFKQFTEIAGVPEDQRAGL